jgi:hypothetical protein
MIHVPHDLLDPNPTNTADFIMMASRAYCTKNTWCVQYEVTGPPEQKKKYAGEEIQTSTCCSAALRNQRILNVMCLI